MTAAGAYPAPVPDGPDALAPPPGPGVMPPFAAPPTDRNRRTLWIGLIVGGLALVLCGVGGLFGFGVIAVAGADQVKQQARQAVEDYLKALRDEDYPTAYRLRCPALNRQETLDQFAASQREQPRPVDYRPGEVRIGNQVIVPVEVRYDDGEQRSQRFTLSQDRGTGELKVCGID
jgi:hypothetical protein